MDDGSSAAAPFLREPRAVPPGHALAWYGEAMRLWRVSPTMFAVLAAVAIAADVLLRFVPVVGVAVTQIVLPLVECALLYASLAADHGDRPRLAHLVAVVGAPPRAIGAVIAASLLAFVAQVLAADAVTGIDLLGSGGLPASASLVDILLLLAAGILVSLPVVFVAPIALFDGCGLRESFASSFRGFARNPAALLLYGAVSLGFWLFGFATSGLGMLLVLPWIAASSYAAWKDVYQVAAPRQPRPA